MFTLVTINACCSYLIFYYIIDVASYLIVPENDLSEEERQCQDDRMGIGSIGPSETSCRRYALFGSVAERTDGKSADRWWNENTIGEFVASATLSSFLFPLNWVGVCPQSHITLNVFVLRRLVLVYEYIFKLLTFCFIICPDDLIKRKESDYLRSFSLIQLMSSRVISLIGGWPRSRREWRDVTSLPVPSWRRSQIKGMNFTC